MECLDCKQSILDPTDAISFTKVDVEVDYHRFCYALRFHARHALLTDEDKQTFDNRP